MKSSKPTKPSRKKTVMVSTVLKGRVYKVFTETEWKTFQSTGQFNGSVDDLRDGFIHLSTKEQLTGVIDRFFSDKRPLYVAEFSDPVFLQQLKWEVSDSGDIYPHLYDLNLVVGKVSSFEEL